MLILISPAKSLDFETKFSNCKNQTQPIFKEEISTLISALKKLSAAEISQLMSVSPKLAELNFERFQKFAANFDQKNSRQSILAFDGDVYEGIEKANYSDEEFDFAQKNLRILSGLYGILRPLDLMQPYRLEMGTDFKNSSLEKLLAEKNLYKFWGDKISNYLNAQENDVIINLASEEYFSVINQKILTKKLIHIHFKENKNGILKTIGISAKKARGLMTNFIIKNSLKDPQQLQKFNLENYQFSAQNSDQNNYTFIR